MKNKIEGKISNKDLAWIKTIWFLIGYILGIVISSGLILYIDN